MAGTDQSPASRGRSHEQTVLEQATETQALKARLQEAEDALTVRGGRGGGRQRSSRRRSSVWDFWKRTRKLYCTCENEIR